MSSEAAHLHCRFYREQFPEIDQCVVALVKQVTDVAAYVSLCEYDDMEGMVQLSELSKRRIRSIPKLIKVGRYDTFMVLRVDKEKGYIDLSKKRVSREDADALDQKYSKAKTVQSIMRHIASTHRMSLEEVCSKIAWPLYDTFGHAYDGLSKLVGDNADLSILDSLDITPEIRDTLLNVVTRRMAPHQLRVKAKVEVSCFDYEGIEAIQRALIAGRTVANDNSKVNDDDSLKATTTVKLIAPPQYYIVTTCSLRDVGFERIGACIEAIKESIEKEGGTFALKQAPELVGLDEEELAKQKREEEEESESESSDSEEEDEGMGDAEIDESAFAKTNEE
ncbi:eukaryotic initiation factor-2 alpha subunit, putative [Perkinsus marinus ATCC 50983]|uniref:Eukaryotic initiation factor-2 alpha subunit, putative n=1 Tax=Perkinsus marinus (strain ATCC 50983 / TXsc) TaxID=423536 RepID=C5KBN6_PERM5|nr:eukaryotic initiation factor-2 alpha subunit, putative [Perkinsus marinus ATCC 50983]EER18106.1 eukaryotic initiation factor-2 alpha subunit, putative [Perkinsus marinus ATCC 50983]|eukprot:XP_002786310.1 eukaryotic initiation factor-2 alpha subunit, putative [Perkinsus marinus ATCC 50983]